MSNKTNKNIASVDLVFENVDFVNVKKVDKLSLTNVEEVAFTDSVGNKGNMLVAEAATIIFNLANVDCSTSFDEITKDNLQERLSLPDISHLDVHYNDGSNNYIGMPWSEKDEYTNLYEKITFNDNKQVVIEFKKGINDDDQKN